MSMPGNRAGTRPRRKLNQSLIKTVIVFITAGITAAGSAVTGIGAHLGFAPMLTWMFGYAPEKAQGTALRFSLAGGLAAVLTFCVLQSHVAFPPNQSQLFAFGGTIGTHLLRGILLVIGATLGAIIAAPITPKPTATGLLRALQGIAILATLFTITEAMHLSPVTRSDVHYAHWSAWWQLVLLGLGVGAVTQGARLTGGTLLVPALYFLTAVPDGSHGLRSLEASEAAIESLIVVCLASLLPAMGYAQRKLVDTTYLSAAVIGGVLGGVFGGWLLTILYERSMLLFFGLVAMFFAAREIYRLVMAPTTPPEIEPGACETPD